MTSTANGGWIKREEGQDMAWPAFVAKADTGQVHCFRSAREMKECEPLHQSYTHWQPAVLPAPPAKELTQADRDQEAYLEWYRNSSAQENCLHSWHAALAYRDGQNREDLSGKFPPSVSTVLSWGEVDAINNLKRRCGLDTRAHWLSSCIATRLRSSFGRTSILGPLLSVCALW